MNTDKQNFFKEVLKFALIALVIVIPIRIFIAQPFIVSGASMSPTFETGDYLIVDEISYRFEDPERGDVIILKYPEDPSKSFIKRIVGLPGERVKIEDGSVLIFLENDGQSFKIDEDYILNKSNDNFEFSLSEGEYFVMGDNRKESLDSRSWGALPEDMIRGRALLRLLPLNKIGIFPGK